MMKEIREQPLNEWLIFEDRPEDPDVEEAALEAGVTTSAIAMAIHRRRVQSYMVQRAGKGAPFKRKLVRHSFEAWRADVERTRPFA